MALARAGAGDSETAPLGQRPVVSHRYQVRGLMRSGGGRESNPPGRFPRLTGFEDREGHQSPFASRCE